MSDPDDTERWTITELSEQYDVTPRALRFYEEQGLIHPQRHGSQRIYNKRDRARLAWIIRAKNVGFSLGDIRELIDLYDIGDGRETQRISTIERCRERIVALKRQQDDIAASIAELTAFVQQLEAMGEERQKTED